MKTVKQQLGVAIVFTFLVIGAFGLSASADEPKPTPEDYENLADIKSNQEIIEETREAHERFMAAKLWNEAESAELAKNGWCTDWQTMTLVQCSFLHGEQ